jgi:uncharacterized protein RhaS with RHS repeats
LHLGTTGCSYRCSGELSLRADHHTCFPGGALKTDNTAIGVYSAPLTDGTTRGQTYTYDLSGKRTSMQWFLGTTSYSHNDFGGLDSLSDPNGNHYHIAYTLDGHVDSLVLGTGVKEKLVRS